MNKLNFTSSSNNGGKHINKSILPQRSDGFKQFSLKAIFLVLPIVLILCIAAASVILIHDNHYVSQIKNFRSIWYNSSNNVSEIKEKNESFAGWIGVADTDFDYPIFNREYKNCSFYIDENSNAEDTQNLILHTPEKENKEISAAVLCFKDINFYKAHPLIEINTDYDKSDYIVFASLYIDSKEAEKLKMSDGENLQALTEEFSGRSFLKTDFGLSSEDDYLSIILADGNNSFLVLARKMRKGEEINLSLVSAGDITNHP